MSLVCKFIKKAIIMFQLLFVCEENIEVHEIKFDKPPA